MLEKSISSHFSPLSRLERERVRGERKEAQFWRLIYRPLNGQGKMKKGGFGISKLDLQ
jgi:hypothetical protein